VLRGGDLPPGWDDALNRAPQKELEDALWPLVHAAMRDQPRRWADWSDPLSPETLRLAARLAHLTDRRDEAAQLADQAVRMYAVARDDGAGRRFAAAHGAAMHEHVWYQFLATPDKVSTHLQSLRLAIQVAGDAPLDAPPLGPIGETRLELLLFAGDEAQARVQAAALVAPQTDGEAVDARLAEAYLRLVAGFYDSATGAAVATMLTWAQRAAQLEPRNPNAHRTTCSLALRLDRDDVAREALRAFRRTESRRDVVDATEASWRSAYPDRPMWGAPREASPGDDPEETNR
jgi:hypothetical protein